MKRIFYSPLNHAGYIFLLFWLGDTQKANSIYNKKKNQLPSFMLSDGRCENATGWDFYSCKYVFLCFKCLSGQKSVTNWIWQLISNHLLYHPLQCSNKSYFTSPLDSFYSNHCVSMAVVFIPQPPFPGSNMCFTIRYQSSAVLQSPRTPNI